MAEKTLSQMEIDKLISQKSGGATASTPAETKAPPAESEPKPEVKRVSPPQSVKSPEIATSPPPIREESASKPTAPPIKATPVVMVTDSTPRPAATPAANLEAIISPLQTAIDALSQRVDGAEMSLLKINMLEKNVAASSHNASQSSKQIMERMLYLEQELANMKNLIQTLSNDLRSAFTGFGGLTEQVNEINRGLRGTIGYDIQNNFTCQSCGSHGYVAGLVRCSECEEEDWWGWWPPEE